MTYRTGEATVPELERNFRLSDRVYRFLTVRLEDDAEHTRVVENETNVLESLEGIEADFGSGGIEHLLREPSELIEDEEADEDSGDDRDDRDSDDDRRGGRRGSRSSDDSDDDSDDSTDNDDESGEGDE